MPDSALAAPWTMASLLGRPVMSDSIMPTPAITSQAHGLWQAQGGLVSGKAGDVPNGFCIQARKDHQQGGACNGY